MSPNRRSTAASFSSEPSSHRDLFASTVRGLEHLASEELTGCGYRLISTRKRQLLLAAPWPLPRDRPRTVDDLLVQTARTADPGPTKADLRRLRPWLEAADLRSVADDFDRGERVLAVSASISGRRTYSRHDLESVIGSFLSERLEARFASRRHGARPPVGTAEWRAVLSPEGLLLGYRGRRPPLHRRPWKTASIPGTLHPPVAAAMVRLAALEAEVTMLDPCCGAGTILVEAAETAPRADIVGSDLDPEALAASAQNACHLDGIALLEADAGRIPMGNGTVDRIVTNPAWGRQVAMRGRFPALLAEWRRVITADGRLVCLVQRETLRYFDSRWSDWSLVATRPLSLSGRHPVIAVAEPRRIVRPKRTPRVEGPGTGTDVSH